MGNILASAVLAAGPDGDGHGHAEAAAHGAGHVTKVAFGEGGSLLMAVPALTIGAVIACGLCAALGVRSKLPAWITVGALVGAFLCVLKTFLEWNGQTAIVHGFEWITFRWGGGPHDSLTANFSFYVDTLTLLWMLFVTGLGALIALYASEYMSHDVGLGYCRFFAAFNLFVFSMSCLVMADNLVLLYLGWEGVGLCSYLLIGYFYKKAPAVAAGKKAFIMNRIGDLGLALGIMLLFKHFGTVQYRDLIPIWQDYVNAIAHGHAEQVPGVVRWAALLLTVGAFGKSAQLFFYVWLPDAMEGPTPVSALIHAATMVTAGVFLIARVFPLYAADPALVALTVVAWSGAITAFWAATIEMAIFDIKRVMGYSTISQLGFMFAGLGVLTPVGASFHTFTHAFFKATLFLGVGAVMHGFGGQLDLRRLSGVAWMRGFGLVGIAMLVGAINLSGVPFTAGFFSKDMILAGAFSLPQGTVAGSQALGWLLLLTAGMTAYYTFRTYFRVYAGPKEFVPGEDPELVDMGRHPKGTTLDEWHAQHGHGHGHDPAHGHDHGHSGHGHGSVADRRMVTRVDFDPTTEEFDPHPPGMAMKVAIGAAMVLSILAAALYFVHAPDGAHGGWVGGMVATSSANYHEPHGGTILGQDPHKVMYFVSAAVGLAGILIAAYLHGPRGWQGLFIGNRDRAATARADAMVPMLGGLVKVARNKYYVDEFYHAVVVVPLRVLAHVFAFLDNFLVDGLVNLFGFAPRGVGTLVRPSQSGVLHDYALRMLMGIGLVLAVALAAMGGAL
jgi:NADH-quinone oxidoreductase subunit L